MNKIIIYAYKFQLTRSVGSVTVQKGRKCKYTKISTHTLRGERDSVDEIVNELVPISTHTLRGERDIVGASKRPLFV